VALALTPGIGARRHRVLVAAFGSAAAAWMASASALGGVDGMTPKSVEAVLAARGGDPHAAAERCRAGAEDGPWRLICLPEQEYPDQLRELYDPPAVIWVRGQLPVGPCVAVVGSRRATPYGLRVARRLAEELATAGVPVISGLARGIDTAAHVGALAGGGPTVAVLGCGIDRVYPPENRELSTAVSQRGALMSELPPGFAPLAGHFPARNRLISGLAAVTVIVEAGERSGALITADLALEQGREVMAVPGNITSPTSVGCNRLIAQGARPVLSAADVLEELGRLPAGRGVAAVSSPGGMDGRTSDDGRGAVGPTGRVLAAVTDEGSSLDDIVAATGLSAREVSVALTALQLDGRVEAVPGGRFVSFSRQGR